MATPAFDDSSFLVAFCPTCDKETLTHLSLGPEDDMVRCCVHCDAPVTGELFEIDSADLEDKGYAVVEARTCGNGGGCGSGCGSRQRA